MTNNHVDAHPADVGEVYLAVRRLAMYTIDAPLVALLQVVELWADPSAVNVVVGAYPVCRVDSYVGACLKKGVNALPDAVAAEDMLVLA